MGFNRKVAETRRINLNDNFRLDEQSEQDQKIISNFDLLESEQSLNPEFWTLNLEPFNKSCSPGQKTKVNFKQIKKEN